MQCHLLPAREKHEFGRMTADILCIQVFFAKCFNFDLRKIRKAFCELYRETFERGACEACLQVVYSRTFR